MELTKQKYGYRLTIGSHNILLMENDLQELAQLLGLHGIAVVEPGQIELPEELEYLDKSYLRDIGVGEHRKIRVAADKVRSMYSTVYAFNQAYGRKVACKAAKSIDGSYDRQHPTYIISRLL